MKQTNIFSRWICLAMLLGCVGVSWGQTTWKKLTGGGSLQNGNYQIQDANLNITSSITIENGRTVTIDLNGYVLSGGKASEKYLEYVIKVEAGGTLTIVDSSPTIGHGGKLREDAYYILYWVGENGNKPFNGGTIYNGYVDAGTDRKGIEVSGTCIIERANIMGCYSTTNGAAVTVNAGGRFIMNGGEISYNCAVRNGGGIYSLGSITLDGGENKDVKIQYNKALGVGNPQSTQSTKIDYGYGGGICATASSTDLTTDVKCSITNSKINYNYAGRFGGGIYSSVATEITGSEIQHNNAMYSETQTSKVTWNSGRGGGFCFIGGGTGENAKEINFTLDNTIVEYNACMYYGGGGHIQSAAILTQKNGTKINNNTSVLHGAAGLHVTASAHFKFEDGEISKNVAHSVGGGIHSSYDCTLELTGGIISNNKAHHRGGGVHVNTGGDLKLNGTDITGNEVLNGLNYKYSTVSFKSDGSTSYSEPTSDSNTPFPYAGYGGGVLVDAGTCEMNAGELSSNKAEVGGGALALVMINTDAGNAKDLLALDVVQFTLNNGSIINNETEGDGGGVYLMENRIEEQPPTDGVINTSTDTQKKWNELKDGIPKAIINGGTLTDNVANSNGGALLVNGNVTMTDGTFTKNKAQNGGGICIIGGTVGITKGNIIKNTATNYGGGIYVENNDPNAVITLSGEGVFEKNTAKAGGGMAVNGPFTFNFAGTLQNNNAVNGGGIYLLKGKGNSGDAKGATLQFNGGFIRNNTATGTAKLANQTAYQKDVDAVTGVGGGVFMADYTTLDFDVTGTLGFYGNRATNAADDIFANGKGTSVTLPAVENMTLKDFSVPASKLFWAEDYYSHYENDAYERDANYTAGTELLPTGLIPNHNLRYQFALQNLKRDHITLVEAGKFNDSHKGKYVCLALGYEIFYVTIKKKGLQEGESAMFNILTTKDGVPNLYISMLLSNNEKAEKEGEWIIKRVALPQGVWTVAENMNWSWSYTPEGQTIVEKSVNNDEVVFEFENTKNNAGLHDEDIEVNEMGKKNTSTGK